MTMPTKIRPPTNQIRVNEWMCVSTQYSVLSTMRRLVEVKAIHRPLAGRQSGLRDDRCGLRVCLPL